MERYWNHSGLTLTVVGDAILQIEDISVEHLSHDQLVDLMNTKDSLMLVVAEIGSVSE